MVDINTDLLEEFNKSKNVGALNSQEYELLRTLSATFETDIQMSLQEIAKDANGAGKEFITTIRTRRDEWESLYFDELEELLTRSFTKNESEKLRGIFDKLHHQALEIIDKSNNINKEEYYQLVNRQFSALEKNIDDLKNAKEMKHDIDIDIDEMYLNDHRVNVVSNDVDSVVPYSESTAPNVTITKNKLGESIIDNSTHIKDFKDVATNPKYQSSELKSQIAELPKIQNDIKDLQNKIIDSKTGLDKVEKKVFETQDWLTTDQRTNSRKKIIGDKNKNSLINQINEELDQEGVQQNANVLWFTSSVDDTTHTITWNVPNNFGKEIEGLVNRLNILTGAGADKPTKYNNIVDMLKDFGSPEDIDKAVNDNNLPTSSWFGETKVEPGTVQAFNNEKLDKMSIDDSFDVDTYLKASPENQKNWIYKNWSVIRKKNRDAMNMVEEGEEGEEYNQNLVSSIRTTGLMILDEINKGKLLEKVEKIQTQTLPQLITQNTKDVQKIKIEGGDIVTAKLAKNIITRMKVIMKSLDFEKGMVDINLNMIDRESEREYKFNINVYDTAILNTLNSLQVTKSILDIELVILESLKSVKDEETANKGWYESLANTRIFS